MLKNFGLSDEHTLSLKDISERLNTSLLTGLDSEEALCRLSKNGLNRFTRPKINTFQRVVKRKKPVWSESEWNRVFNTKLADTVTVIRDNQRVVIKGADVVIGDIVELVKGDKAPGDIRIIDSKDLRVNNLLITGEKEAKKSERCTSIDPLLSENMVFACTQVIRGRCLGIVLRTGDATVFGQLNRFAKKVMLPKPTSSAGSDDVFTV